MERRDIQVFPIADARTEVEVLESFAQAIRPWVPQTHVTGNHLVGQNVPINMGYFGTAYIDATVVTGPSGNRELVVATVTNPNTLFWVCGVLGFCTLILWAGVVIYFVTDLKEPVRGAAMRAGLPPAMGFGSLPPRY